MHDVESAIASLRAAGMRATPQRRAVLEELVGDTSHPTTEELAARVSRRLPGISLSTIYKTLNEFTDVGLVQRIGGQVMRYDPCTDAHGHSTCTSCGRLGDVRISGSVLDALTRAAAESGFAADSVTASYGGLCAECATASSS